MPMVTTTCGLTVRRIGSVPGGEGVVGPLHERVGQLLGAVAQVALGPVGLHDRLQRGLHLLPADRRRGRSGRSRCRRGAWRWTASGPRWGRVRGRRGRAVPGSGAPPGPARRAGGWRRRRPARRRPRRGRRPARRRRPGAPSRVTGAITATCSAVTRPAANAAATAGRCSSARPVPTSRCAAAGESRPCPRSQDCMVVSPSCSAAWVSSPSRTVRATWASSRFCAREQPAGAVEHLRAEHAPSGPRRRAGPARPPGRARASPEPSEHMYEEYAAPAARHLNPQVRRLSTDVDRLLARTAEKR